MMSYDYEREQLEAAREREWRHAAILRISELTSRAPAAVLAGDAQRAHQWKEAASKARKLIERKAPPTTSLRTALTLLEQFEC